MKKTIIFGIFALLLMPLASAQISFLTDVIAGYHLDGNYEDINQTYNLTITGTDLANVSDINGTAVKAKGDHDPASTDYGSFGSEISGLTFTVCMWFKGNSSLPANAAVAGDDGGGSHALFARYSSGNALFYYGGGRYQYYYTGTNATDGNWHHWCFLSNGDDMVNNHLLIDAKNATQVGGGGNGGATDFTGLATLFGGGLSGLQDCDNCEFDEIVIFNRTLSQAEVTELYELDNSWAESGGAGSSDPQYSVDYYTEENVIETHTSKFSAIVDINTTTTENVTGAWLTYPSGQVYSWALSDPTMVRTGINSSAYNFTTSHHVRLQDTNNSEYGFTWTFEFNYTNGTYRNESQTNQTQNVFFGYHPASITPESTNGAVETDLFNWTLAHYDAGEAYSIVELFEFNNTNYTEFGDISLPYVPNDTNYTVYYFLNVTENNISGAIETFQEQIRSLTQTFSLYTFNITDCYDLGTARTLNLTIRNESNDALLTGDFDLSFSVWKTVDQNKTFGFQNTSINTLPLCIHPSFANLSTEAYFIYTADGGYTKRYYLRNATLDNTTQQLYLYNYDSTDLATLLGLTVKDNSFNDYPDVLVKMQRYYPLTAEWKTVQTDLSDEFGLTIFHVIEATTDYRFIFEYQGSILYESATMKFLCDGDCSLTFVMPDGTGDAPSLEGFDYNYTYNNETFMAVVQWNDVSGSSPTVRFLVEEQTMAGHSTICDTSLSNTAGSMSCNLTGQTGMVRVRAYRTASPTLPFVNDFIEFAQAQLGNLLGQTEGLFWSFIIFVTIVLTGLFSGVATIIASAFALIVILFLGLTSILSLGIVISAMVIGLIVAHLVRR